MNSYTVNLTYFKKSGKYYTCGEYVSSEKELNEIWDEVKEMALSGNLPGLARSNEPKTEFNILINVPNHPHDHPRMIVF